MKYRYLLDAEALSAHHNVEIHTINANCGVIFDTQINVLKSLIIIDVLKRIL